MADTLISAEGVAKKFCRNFRQSLWYGLKDIGSEMLGRDAQQHGLRAGEFWAVDDINFTLARGECLGLIGRNGAGKTSLLRMLNGLIRPDKGRIQMKGSVGALIALGAGIKPVLTGRENIYCMAALRGMSRREAARRIDEIVAFSELEDFIDSPMQSYSSGMRVRLSFAVASSLDPDILLLDEVLAVGDAAFRDKCYHRIAQLRRNAAVIFVSHSMEQVARVSSQVLVMSRGKCAHLGDTEQGISCYEQLNQSSSGADGFLSMHPPIEQFEMDHPATSNSGQSFELQVRFKSTRALATFMFKIHFFNSKGSFAADAILQSSGDLRITEGDNSMRLTLDSLPLKNGIYMLAFNIVDEVGDLIVWSYKMHRVEIRGAYPGAIADCQMQMTCHGHQK